MKNVWDTHYNRPKSKLTFPDENLVRLLARVQPDNKSALDFGCGSGRHSILLHNFGYTVTACDNSETTISNLKLENLPIRLFHTKEGDFPFQKNEFGLILSWGVFHYNQREVAKSILASLYETLDDNGYMLGSIRSTGDSHLKIDNGKMNLTDLDGGYAETYSLSELKDFLSIFKSVSIGYSERTPLGKLEERICHWFFLAQK
ncbi:methyltransferase domain-containing protein [Leptospira sp. 96542]|nr:methyltransferase domain-containing protein [Leptospira sp. 96542]